MTAYVTAYVTVYVTHLSPSTLLLCLAGSEEGGVLLFLDLFLASSNGEVGGSGLELRG